MKIKPEWTQEKINSTHNASRKVEGKKEEHFLKSKEMKR